MNKRRDYSDAELAHFARYGEERALAMPQRCSGGDQCWVLHGPPAFSSEGVCSECRTLPAQLQIDVKAGRRRLAKPRRLRR